MHLSLVVVCIGSDETEDMKSPMAWIAQSSGFRYLHSIQRTKIFRGPCHEMRPEMSDVRKMLIGDLIEKMRLN